MFNDENALEADNFFKKLKLAQDFGMQGISSNMDPQAESQWLDYIMEFEQNYNHAKKIKIRDFIQNPSIKPSNELSDEQVEMELQSILAILDKNFISLQVFGNESARKIYDFIVKELFEHEIRDVHIEGAYLCFTYEDFHPNHNSELQRLAEEYVKNILYKNDILTEYELYDDLFIDEKGNFLKKKQVKEIILAFQASYRNCVLKFFDTNQIDFDLIKAEALVRFQTAYSCDNRYFEGEGKIFFAYMYGYWYVSGVVLPNFKLGRIQ